MGKLTTPGHQFAPTTVGRILAQINSKINKNGTLPRSGIQSTGVRVRIIHVEEQDSPATKIFFKRVHEMKNNIVLVRLVRKVVLKLSNSLVNDDRFKKTQHCD